MIVPLLIFFALQRYFVRADGRRGEGLAAMATVSFERVTKRFDPATAAVEDFDLEIEDREFLVLVGPSGCGKSTTLRLLAGLEEVTSGTIRIGERVVNNVPARDRDIAMVFQNYALYPHMTVYDNMALASPSAACQGSDSSACPGSGPHPGHREPAQAEARATLGRATSARGTRPCDRPRSRRLPPGRAPL
jgi:ABC-type branched-subunit amino acid transport system ATPase component